MDVRVGELADAVVDLALPVEPYLLLEEGDTGGGFPAQHLDRMPVDQVLEGDRPRSGLELEDLPG
ncbi:hypothetical protein ABZ568_16275 [Streptomyces olindensis]|uniref:Uncharacterized protein n=1 Tax=Streptomyces olindensis TaxID=358823 RepID=A0ABV2XVB2_9ACTN